MPSLPRWFSFILFVSGLGFLLGPPSMEAYAHYHQSKLAAELADNPVMAYLPPLPAGQDRDMDGRSPGPVEDALRPEERPDLPPLAAPFRIEIPRIAVDAVVLDGISADVLRKGPGLYPHGVRPGEKGNVAIAGHRTTYGAWFRHVDKLAAGDEIILTQGSRRIVYRVEKVFPVAHNDWSVIAPTDYHALTLTTCHPPGSAAERLIVRAREIVNEDFSERPY